MSSEEGPRFLSLSPSFGAVGGEEAQQISDYTLVILAQWSCLQACGKGSPYHNSGRARDRRIQLTCSTKPITPVVNQGKQSRGGLVRHSKLLRSPARKNSEGYLKWPHLIKSNAVYDETQSFTIKSTGRFRHRKECMVTTRPCAPKKRGTERPSSPLVFLLIPFSTCVRLDRRSIDPASHLSR